MSEAFFQVAMFILGFFSNRLLIWFEKRDSLRKNLKNLRLELIYNLEITKTWPTPRFQDFPFMLDRVGTFIKSNTELVVSQQCFQALAGYYSILIQFKNSWSNLRQFWLNDDQVRASVDKTLEELKEKVGTEKAEIVRKEIVNNMAQLIRDVKDRYKDEIDSQSDSFLSTLFFPELKKALENVENELHLPFHKFTKAQLSEESKQRNLADLLFKVRAQTSSSD